MIKSDKVLGIKIHSPCHGYPILEHCDKIFSFANERSLTVQMHPDQILEMPKVCDRYPNMKLIIAHLGYEDYIDAVKNSKAGNIYVDTSGGASNLNNVLEYAVKTIGAEKILFGTDTYSSAFQAGRVAFARITDEEKRLILRDNAIRMFPWAFK
jgi:predicted TIM-barrel fold metal-dependent hydrolase